MQTQYNLRIEKEVLEQIKEQATKDKRTTNKEICFIIEKYLNDQSNDY